MVLLLAQVLIYQLVLLQIVLLQEGFPYLVVDRCDEILIKTITSCNLKEFVKFNLQSLHSMGKSKLGTLGRNMLRFCVLEDTESHALR